MEIRQYDYHDIALKHLETSLELYNQENYICALQLACAAEEILGGMATQMNLKNMNELRKDVWLKVAQKYGSIVATQKELSAHQNRLKNAFKHFNEKESKLFVELLIKKDASMFIHRAIMNYCMVFSKYPEAEVFKKPPIPI